MNLSRRALFAGAAAIVAAANLPAVAAAAPSPTVDPELRAQLLVAIKRQFEKIVSPVVVGHFGPEQSGPSFDAIGNVGGRLVIDEVATKKLTDAAWAGLTTLLEAWEQLTGDSVGAVKLAMDTPDTPVRAIHGDRIWTAQGAEVTAGPRLPARFLPDIEFVGLIDGPYKPAS